MKALRSHILKKGILLLLAVGFCMPFMQPVEAVPANPVFNSWMHTVIEKSDDAVLKQKLRQLATSGGSIDQLIRKASKIIEKSDGPLQRPDKSAETSQKMYRMLLLEWNRYQSGNSMTAVPASQTIKPVVDQVQQFRPGGIPGFTKEGSSLVSTYTSRSAIHFVCFQRPHHLQSLSSSIVIGAP